MSSPYRSPTPFGPAAAGRPAIQQDDGFGPLLESAASLAQGAGRSAAMARNWFHEVALKKYPITTLGMAFSLGVFAGWFVKRR